MLADVTVPVMQSSANLSGGADPRSLDEVDEALRDGADLVVDGGDAAGHAVDGRRPARLRQPRHVVGGARGCGRATIGALRRVACERRVASPRTLTRIAASPSYQTSESRQSAVISAVRSSSTGTGST